MKKLIALLFISIFLGLGNPSTVHATPNCHTATMTCPDGSTHVVFYCGADDWWAWSEILCGVAIDD
ncbi:MAG: hypothetical protein FD155_1760 [Bacteroidetes bacterium]|nr:MAG: hypothetical protein FD155_1760 [Bacteroidota bacterium]